MGTRKCDRMAVEMNQYGVGNDRVNRRDFTHATRHIERRRPTFEKVLEILDLLFR